MSTIVEVVSNDYGVEAQNILVKTLGRQSNFEARKVAMYLCQELTGEYLRTIAEYFNLSYIGSVSYNTSMIRKKRKEDKGFAKLIDRVISTVAKQAI